MVVINKLYPSVIKTCRPLILEDQMLKVLVRKFSESISKSLIAEHVDTSTVKSNMTHVSDFPDGTETGGYLGLEFSGKRFRLAYIGLKGDRTYVTFSRLYEFPDQKLNENVTKVAEYIAKCVNNFLDVYDIEENKTILGVASSFPLTQECLQEGLFDHWGEDFKSEDLKGKDFFLQLKLALKKYNLTKKLYLISLVSSATACLMAGLYKHPGVRIALHLGDETNISYIEKFENMTTHKGDGLRTRTVLGVDVKTFGDDGALNFIRTECDYQVDDASDNPGKNILEKLVSSVYLGEIARLFLLKLTRDGIILNGCVSPELTRSNSLKSSDLAMMEMDDEVTFVRCRAVMWNLGYKEVTKEDCVQIRFVCRSVVRRSCNLIAACLTALLYRMDTKHVYIMADGSLIQEYPNYEKYLVKKMQQLKKREYKFMMIKGEIEEVAAGAGLVAHIYKDGVIKLEDKYRSLPPFNVNKYQSTETPASLIDCECKIEEKNRQSVTTMLSQGSRITKKSSGVFEISEPLFTIPIV